MKYAEVKHQQGQAKQIGDAEIVDAVRRSRGRNGVPAWSTTSDVAGEFPQFHYKVVMAKLSSAIRRGLLRGCDCGCRGDFEIPGEESGSEWDRREKARMSDERWAALCDEKREPLTEWAQVIPGRDLHFECITSGVARWMAIRDGRQRIVEWRDVKGAEAR